jgi:hypothetical protein
MLAARPFFTYVEKGARVNNTTAVASQTLTTDYNNGPSKATRP